MGAVELLAILVSLINSGVNGLAAAQKVSGLIAQRRAENKPFTREDLDAAVAQDDEARKVLEQAIANG